MVVAENTLVDRLRSGDNAAFRDLVSTHHQSMVRVASSFVSTRAVAEEVVQDTWIAVIKGIDRFEGRASLKTWIYRILANQARDRAVREVRTVPVSSLSAELDDDAPSLSVENFMGPHGRGMWAQPLSRWSEIPDERLLAGETFSFVEASIATLPENQRRVLVLRDVEGWSSEEVCGLLEISEVNQRVLLHRARATLRALINAEHVRTGGGADPVSGSNDGAGAN